MRSKPVILIIENSIDVTGALKSITRTAFDLKEYFDFHFIIPKHSRGRFWIESKGFTDITELPMRELSKRFSSLLLYIPFLAVNAIRLRQIVRRQSVSLIHVNDLYNLLPVILKTLNVRVPYVCHIRFMPNRFPKILFDFWLKLHLKHANKIITVSQSVQSMLPENEKIQVIHNELPVEERYPELILPSEESTQRVFLYLGNFIPGKGQNFALEAFAAIHEEVGDWKLRFVGSDMGLRKNFQYKLKLKEKAKQLGIERKIEWVGFTEEVEWEYKHADVALNFSESESFSITCLEALFFGRPVIATDCGGPSEIIDDGQSGIIVPNRDISAMANAMKYLATHNQERREFGAIARAIVRERFSYEKTSHRLRQVYEGTLKLER